MFVFGGKKKLKIVFYHLGNVVNLNNNGFKLKFTNYQIQLSRKGAIKLKSGIIALKFFPS